MAAKTHTRSIPTAGLRTLDASKLAAVDAWGGPLEELAAWADEIPIAFDEDPSFDANENPEIDTQKRLAADLAYRRRATRRLFVDWRANSDAYRHLRRLPREGESLHGIISGKYALWEMVPALLERHKGERIEALYLATLGFSKQNGADLADLLAGGQVRRAALICSHYFKSTSAGIYDLVIPDLIARGVRVLAMRTHCKLILARMSGGARYVAESSANLRSCVNVEQFVLTRCPKLYQFHRRWLEREILGSNAAKKPKTTGNA